LLALSVFPPFFINPLLGDPKVSGEAIYYLVADPAMRHISGKLFHLTVEEIPAKHALDRKKGCNLLPKQKLTCLK